MLIIIFSLMVIAPAAQGIDIFYEWKVSFDSNIRPVQVNQPVITINGMFPGPLINSSTNDVVHVNVFNHLDEPLLFTWNGIQQRLDSWQDGVSGTNCPIEPGRNWTYVFQVKDQIGTYFYFPSINYLKAAGGYGPLRVNNRNVILIPFAKPEKEFDLLIGDWLPLPYKTAREILDGNQRGLPPASVTYMLINGKPAFKNTWGKDHESFEVKKGKTYRFRISNVGNALSFNFRIQNHKMVVVETEGSYTDQIVLDSLDVHVGQSYSVLVTMDQHESDHYIVASPTQLHASQLTHLSNGVAVLRYSNSESNPEGPLPSGPDPQDRVFSVEQARSIRWNLTAGAARPNPQGSFNVERIKITHTFILHTFPASVGPGRHLRYTINNISYSTPSTPLKLADYFFNGKDVYHLDQFPLRSINKEAAVSTSVVSGIHKEWHEIVFQNPTSGIESWHLDGFGFYVVGFGIGEWSPRSRDTYNLHNPVVRSTTQVYSRGWTAVYVFLDNPGMWNLRSQLTETWYLGGEMYVRVHDPDPNPAKERPPPDNLLICGLVSRINNATA